MSDSPNGDTTVFDADTVVHLVPPAVPPSATLPALVAAVASDPRARCAFVVDAGSHLLGIVPEGDLDRDLALLLAPESAAVEHAGIRAIAQAARGVSETASDLMRPATTVRPTDRLAAAVRHMRSAGQETAALVDADGVLIGYLSLFEVLAALLPELRDTESPVADHAAG